MVSPLAVVFVVGGDAIRGGVPTAAVAVVSGEVERGSHLATVVDLLEVEPLGSTYPNRVSVQAGSVGAQGRPNWPYTWHKKVCDIFETLQ